MTPHDDILAALLNVPDVSLEVRLLGRIADPVIGKMRQAYARTSGRVLEFVGREIASGGVEQASVIADRAVARFQASRR